MLKPTSPKQFFAARIERLKLSWEASPQWFLHCTGTNYDLLQRFCDDDRMQEAWDLLNTIDENAFGDFVKDALDAIESVRFLPALLRCLEGWRANIAEARQKTEEFIEMCESLYLFQRGAEMYFLKGDLSTMGERFPDLLVQARAAHSALLAEAANMQKHETEATVGISRKPGDGRGIMARDLVSSLKKLTGAPHYGVVAALLNAALDTGDEDDISADAVRKAVTRGPDNSNN